MSEPIEAAKRVVRRAYPDAKVRPDGLMFTVFAGSEQISQRRTTIARAWLSAAQVVLSNQP